MRWEEDMMQYRKLIERDSASKPLNSSEKSSIINKCMQEAQNQQWCVRVPGINSPRDYIYKLGYHIEEEETELMPGFLYMGIMEPDRQTIRLNLRVINLAETYMEKSLHLSREAEQVKKFRDIILFHELYHVIEEKTPGIYTRNVRIRHRIAGILGWNRKLESASEIGAIHFSKLMTDASFSPCLYTQYLLAAINRDTEVKDEL